MKAISLWQPWASLIAVGAKKIETRSWPTSFRGPLAIHAAKKWDSDLREICEEWPFNHFLPPIPADELPRGCIVATAELRDCVKITFDFITQVTMRSTDEYGALIHPDIHFGDYSEGRFAWILFDVKPLAEPIPARGMQGLFDWEMPV